MAQPHPMPRSAAAAAPAPLQRARAHLPFAGLWSLLCALFFAPWLLGQAHFPAGDFTGQFHAFAQFQAQEMAQGRLPLWSPGSYGGFPFAADIQSAAFYPLRWLTVLASLPRGFSLYLMQLEAVAHVWLCGLFTYALAFLLTRRRPAALLAALAFALGGYLTSYPLLQLAILESITWLPLIVLCLHLATRRRRPLRWLLAAAALLALALSASHPQTFLHVAYVALFYFLFRAAGAGWAWRWLLGGALLLFSVPLGLAAVVWLPALRWSLFSTRADVSYEFVAAGQDLLNAAQMVAPGIRTVWSPEYAGLATLVLALAAWCGRRLLPTIAARRELLFWSALALLAFWLSLGEDGILFRLAYRFAPGFSLFRQQERLWGLVAFALVLLGAQGLALWLQLDAAQRRRLLGWPAALLGFGLAFAGATLLLAPQFDPARAAIGLRQLLLAGALFLLLWLPRRRWTTAALLLLLTADLYLAFPLAGRPAGGDAYWRQPAWLQTLQAQQAPLQPARVDTQNRFLANVGLVYGLEDVRGISPLKPAYLDRLEEATSRARRWQLLGVTHVIDDRPPDPAPELVAAVDEGLEPGPPPNAALYRVADPRPRAWLSYEPLPVDDAEQALQLLASAEFDPARQVVLHGDLPPLDELALPQTAPQSSVQRLRSNALRIDVQSESAALLVISEWRYPGWRATLDGRPIPLYAANYAFQALLAPPGSHTVELRYAPWDVTAGALISLGALLVVLALGWRWQPQPGLRRPLAWPPLALERPLRPHPLRSRPLPQSASAWLLAHWRLALLVLLLVGFALRAFHLGVQELRGDEAFSYTYARLPLAEIVPTLIREGDPHPPLHYLLQGAWLRLSGDSEFAMRYLSVLLSTLLLPLLFRLGRRLWGVRLGLLLPALMALSQSQVWLAQDVRNQYMLSLLFTTLAALALERPLRARGAGLRGWLLYALLCALAMYSHYYSLFALLAHALFLLAGRWRLRRVLRWAAAGVVAFLLFVPWLLMASSGWRDQLFDPGGMALAPYLLTVIRELLAGPALSDINAWAVLGAALLALLGWVTLWWRRPEWAALLGGWLVAALLGIFLITLRRATFNPFYAAIAAPTWWALVGVGLLALWRQRGRWRRVAPALAVVAALALVAIPIVSLARYYGDPLTYGRSAGYRALAAHMAAKAEAGDLFLANFPDPALTYYLRRQQLPQLLQPGAPETPAAQTEAELAQLASEFRRLWFAPRHSSIWDPEDVALRWLDYHFLLEEERRFQSLTLQLYRPLDEVGDLLLPLQERVQQSVLLEGAHLTVDGVAAPGCPAALPVAVGAQINVSLVWQAMAPIAEDSTVFVHLLAADGRLLAQHDGVPAHGTRPTSSWQPGERILDEHLLALPAGSAEAQALEGATLWLGLYDPASGERRLFDGGGEALALCMLTLAPPGGEP